MICHFVTSVCDTLKKGFQTEMQLKAFRSLHFDNLIHYTGYTVLDHISVQRDTITQPIWSFDTQSKIYVHHLWQTYKNDVWILYLSYKTF